MKKINFPFSMISGAIGKKLVIKQYRNGTVATRYPDMAGIIASPGQRECRNLFKEAVAFARQINNDPEKKKAFRQKGKKGSSFYHASISEYMLRAKNEINQQQLGL